MTDAEKIDLYLKKHALWADKLQTLRTLLNSTSLKEKVKWGAPAYTLNKKILIGLGAFKNHMGIWFHQGVFLKDTQNQLMNAQEEKTKALRQWRFHQEDTINEALVAEYIKEAIQNAVDGKEHKPERNKTLVLPELLREACKQDPAFNAAFNSLSPGKQREYAAHINSAKREATQQSRLTKILPMILQGAGLHDKYKNC